MPVAMGVCRRVVRAMVLAVLVNSHISNVSGLNFNG